MINKKHQSKKAAEDHSKRSKDAVTIVVLLLIAALVRLPWLFSTIERDEGIFGYLGWRISLGEMPVELDTKIPFISYIYSGVILLHQFLGFSFPEIITIRILNNILFFAAVIFVYMISKEFLGRKAFVSALVFILFMNTPALEGQFALTEPMAVCTFAIGLLLLLRYANQKCRKKSMLAASVLLFAAASLLRYPFAFFSAYALYSLIPKKGGSKKSAIIAVLVFFAVLFVSAVIITLPYFTVYKEYFSSIATILSAYFQMPSTSVNFRIVLYEGLFFWIASIGGIVISVKHSNLPLFRNFFFISVPLFFISPFYGHHALITALSVSLLSAVFIFWCFENMSKQHFAAYILSAFLFISAAASFSFSQMQYPNLKISFKDIVVPYTDFQSYGDQLAVASFLSENLGENETFNICGFDGGSYWLSKKVIPNDFQIMSYCTANPQNTPSQENIFILNCTIPNNSRYVLFLGEQYYPKNYSGLCNGKKMLSIGSITACDCWSE